MNLALTLNIPAAPLLGAIRNCVKYAWSSHLLDAVGDAHRVAVNHVAQVLEKLERPATEDHPGFKLDLTDEGQLAFARAMALDVAKFNERCVQASYRLPLDPTVLARFVAHNLGVAEPPRFTWNNAAMEAQMAALHGRTATVTGRGNKLLGVYAAKES